MNWKVAGIALSMLLLTACDRKSSTEEVVETDTTVVEVAKPETPPDDGLTPEQRAAAAKIPRPVPDASGKIDLGAMTVQVPEGWEFVTPVGLMRRAQFSVPGVAGEAETTVFFLGRAGAGSVDSNIDRWIRQFSNKDGSAVVDVVPTEKKIAGFEVTLIDVAGEYNGGMTPSGTPGEAVSDQRLLAAIVKTDQGPYYIKLLGPGGTVSNNKAAFDGMLASMKPVKEGAPEKDAKSN